MTVEVEDVVAGRRLDRSVADFVRSCEVLIREQQERASPDNAGIATLCDAVRLASLSTRTTLRPMWCRHRVCNEELAPACARREGGYRDRREVP